jgi:ABC-2 type transport system permease protein
VGIAWDLPKLALLFLGILSGACIFGGLFVLQATLAFWTVETLELMNTVTYGGVETSQYPLTLYTPWFRGFFMTVVPLACMNYFPAHAILGRTEALGTSALWHWTAPLAGFVFLRACLQAWKIGVHHYRSTGS